MKEVIEILKARIQEVKEAVEELEQIILYLEADYEKELKTVSNTLAKIHRAIESITGEKLELPEPETKVTQIH